MYIGVVLEKKTTTPWILFLYLISEVYTCNIQMPARDQWFQCVCPSCCKVGLDGLPTNPHGKRILRKYQADHLAETRNSSRANSDVCRAAVLGLARQTFSASTSVDADSITAALFSNTLSDNNPDIASQPSKLWCSQDQFPHISPPLSTRIDEPDVEGLADSIGRIAVSNKLRPYFCSYRCR